MRTYLDDHLPQDHVLGAVTLHDAMAYSVLGGGKRVRAMLVMLGAQLMDVDPRAALPLAGGIEMIHAYSLIHDDLPAMDNDDLRRGKPTNHKVYGEGMAILAGDALLTNAMEWMLGAAMDFTGNRADWYRAAHIIIAAAGMNGMALGQALDLQFEGQPVDMDALRVIHKHKTGALMQAAVSAGVALGPPSEQQMDAVVRYGAAIGLAFQIRDDLLDVTGGKALGKTLGKDAAAGKATYPGLMGIQESEARIAEVTEDAVQALAVFGGKESALVALAHSLAGRVY